MDMTKYGESEFVNADLVQRSNTKKLVIVAPARETMYENKLQAQFAVNMDGKQKTFRPNMETVQNLIQAWGKDDSAWVGKIVDLSVKTMKNNKLGVIGTPAAMQVPQVG